MTFASLMRYASDTVFTGRKDSGSSYGSVSSNFYQTSGSGGGMRGQDCGDLFIDFDDELVANAQSGFDSAVTRVRLTTMFKEATRPVSNGHWFAGLGGHHENGANDWVHDYESAPNSGYCSLRNMYGTSPGNAKGQPISRGDCSTNGLTTAQLSSAVSFAVYAMSDFKEPKAESLLTDSTGQFKTIFNIANDESRQDCGSSFWTARVLRSVALRSLTMISRPLPTLTPSSAPSSSLRPATTAAKSSARLLTTSSPTTKA